MSRRKRNIRIMSLMVTVIMFFSSCSAQPQPITYGTDQCDLCKMGIIDERFGAELVTKKGKVYKFDSGECMINYLRHEKVKKDEVASLWVVSPAEPRKLIDATQAFYLHSEKFPSPMGAFLSAFESEEQLKQFRDQYSGEVWTWEEAMKQVK